MSIITISRGSYSRGKEIAEKLASRLGYECLSRDILLEASAEFNIPELKLIRALHDAPTILDRFRDGQRHYINYIRSALLQHILKDNIVYHGLAGHYFLKDIPHVLKIRIIADMEDRVKEEMLRAKISEKEALYILQKDDDERRKWGLQLYGIDTWDSRLYDIVFHIKTLTIDDAVDMIAETIKKPIYQTTPGSRKLLIDTALAAKVQAVLTYLAPMVTVTADDGVVRVGNIYEKQVAGAVTLDRIKKIVGEIDGVKDIIINLISKKEKPGHINPFYNME